MDWLSYSFLTKSAKLKRVKPVARYILSYSFLTKSAKLKLLTEVGCTVESYSFLTKSAKLKRRRTTSGTMTQL